MMNPYRSPIFTQTLPMKYFLTFLLINLQVAVSFAQWNVVYDDAAMITALHYNIQSPDDQVLYTMHFGDASLLLRSDDFGQTWDSTVVNQTSVFQNLLFFTADTGIIVRSDSLYHTSDAGQTWNSQPVNCACLPIYPQEVDGIVYLVTHTVDYGADTDSIWLLKSSDHGQSWTTHVSFPSPDSTFISQPHNLHHPSFLVINDSTYLLGTHNNTYRTTNSGTSWSITGPASFGGGGFQMLSDSVILHTSKWGATEMFKSTDQGQSWANMLIPAAFDVLFADEQVGYIASVGSDTSGIWPTIVMYRTEDEGSNWTADTILGFPHATYMATSLQELAVLNRDTAFAVGSDDHTGSFNGLIVGTLNGGMGTGFSDPDQTTASVAVYPVPTKDLLHIQFINADKPDLIKALEIVDQTGRIVQTKTFSHLRSSGVSLDVSGLAHGLYFIRLTNDKDEVAVRRFIRQ